MTALSNIEAPTRDYLWSHAPSPSHWSVRCYGGKNPRTGFDQPNLEVQFAKRTRPDGYGLGRKGILYRANDYAQMQHRTHFAVRDSDGSIIYDGPVLNEIEAPVVIGRLTDAELNHLAGGHKGFNRQERRVGGSR